MEAEEEPTAHLPFLTCTQGRAIAQTHVPYSPASPQSMCLQMEVEDEHSLAVRKCTCVVLCYLSTNICEVGVLGCRK